MLSCRSGNKNQICGNFMLQAGRSGAGGIKMSERDQKIFNNYIEGVSDYPVMLEGGDAYSDSNFAHAQVFRALVVHNTIVNPGRTILINHGSKLPPTDCVFANNIITGTGTLFTDNGSANLICVQNMCWPAAPSHAGFTSVNPMLASSGGIMHISSASPAINTADTAYFTWVTDDIDGQPRNDGKPDVGADEYSTLPVINKPLVPADVGPDATTGVRVPAYGVYTNHFGNGMAETFKVIGGRFSIPRTFAGEKISVSVFDATGKLLQKTVTSDADAFHFKAYHGTADIVYIVQIRAVLPTAAQ
jgi:hypothetical protein